jgi:hypothetical protein
MRHGHRLIPGVAEAPDNTKMRRARKVPAVRNEDRAVGVANLNGKNDGARTWTRSDASDGPSPRDIPSESSFSHRALVSHETACILNAGDRDAHVTITIFFADRDPVGPYRLTVAARRTLHLRFNDLDDPASIPRDTDYASVFESDVPIILQHTRLDSRHAEVSLLSTMAYPEG